MVKVSVITVCYNAEKEIRDTAKSVLSQTFDNYEYLIIDGDSKDNTLKIIQEFRQAFDEKNIDYKLISEPDKGIYDAMNKGIDVANGEWVIFMNAGDEFVDGNALMEVFSRNISEADVLYGDVILKFKDFFRYKKCLSSNFLYDGMPFCHQSTFTKKSLMKKFYFDSNYKICADWDLFLRMYISGSRFVYVDMPIAIYDLSGISSIDSVTTKRESQEIRKKNNIELHLCKKIRIKVRSFVAFICKKYLKKVYYSKKRGWHKSLNELMEKSEI